MTDKYSCPLHSGGVLTEGDAHVFIGAHPVARVGDKATCEDETVAKIVTGAATVKISGRSVARTLELVAHGGTIVEGAKNVLIGGPSSSAILQSPIGPLLVGDHGNQRSGNQVTAAEFTSIITESQIPNVDWDLWDIIKWKSPGWAGGGTHHLLDYKDQWIRDHATSIIVTARINHLPPELVGGVAWIEVGGDPTFIDQVAHDVRSLDHIRESSKLTRRPELTSGGDVSIQIRRVAETLGIQPDLLDYSARARILEVLEDDQRNLQVVGMHLAELKSVDFLNHSGPLDDSQIIVIGSRYNRGPELSLDRIMENTSYGDTIIRHRQRILDLLFSAAMQPSQSGPRPVSRGTVPIP